MRILSLFVMVVLMSVLTASQTLAAPQAITDPKQIASKPDARVEKTLSIEKLLYGTLKGVRDQLLRRRDRLGISYYTFPSRAMETMAPLVEALAGK